MRHRRSRNAAAAAGLASPSSGLLDDLASLGTDAASAAAVEPQKQTPAVGAGAAGGHENEHDDSATDRASLEKLTATTKAQFAQLGFGLLELADGSFLATRWACCRPLVDLKAARAFLRQLGGAA
jgi:hypothetical protein